ncbi:hypothetical protein PVAP13_8NG182101 [Panicum virgatum]|uniref:Uncharacterized protein n=1 Tax=Panicum virgatum TaxID=38727 RepID=A0A8T0P4J8_PANVG|nr:hypothetical protein PVAP13_8NG182101 [Panicum virgatum]
MGHAMWLHRPVFLASQRALSSTMPGLPLQNSPDFCSPHVEFGDRHVCQLCSARHQIQETPDNIHGHGGTRSWCLLVCS